MNKYVSGAYCVEIPFTGTNRFYFPEIPQLRNKRIKHIDYVSTGYTPTGKTTIPVTSALCLNVTEANTGLHLIEDLQVGYLNAQGERLFINKIFDLQRSYFEYKSALGDLANKSVCCVLWYDEPISWSLVNEANPRTKIFPLQLNLKGLRTYFAENLNFKNAPILNLFLAQSGYAPDGTALITDRTKKFITLSYKNTEFIKNVPLPILMQELDYFPIRFQGIKFNLQSSYITQIDNADDNKAVFFNAVIDDNQRR